MKLVEYKDRQQQAEMLARLVAGQLQDVIEQADKASLAVPGGTTPGPFLQALAQQTLDWPKVTVTLGDERQVPEDNERSNARLLRENFLERQAGSTANFQPLWTGESLAVVAEKLQASCLPLSVCVLGMGTDGHFASLFPAADNLAEGLDPANREVLLEITADNIPEPRLSLSLAAILSAPHIHLLITGSAKRQVLQQAEKFEQQENAEITLPIQALIRHIEQLTIHYCEDS